MCLAVPGQVVELFDDAAPFARAAVQFGAVQREVSMQCVPDAVVGDYVLVHAGIAITRVDREEAEKTLKMLDELGLDEFEQDDVLDELEGPAP